MPEQAQLHLPSSYLHMVKAVLRQHAPNARVWAYGSRVNGDHHEASDLDLVLHAPDAAPLPFGQLEDLREAFSDSNLPILVQLVDWARIPASFQAEIDAGYVVVQVPPVHQPSTSKVIEARLASNLDDDTAMALALEAQHAERQRQTVGLAVSPIIPPHDPPALPPPTLPV